MKKGVFTLILSFVLCMVWLLYSFMNHHGFGVAVVTKSFSFMSHTVTLPALNLPSFYIIGILALFVNLCALILAMPSFAMGAAVLYAAAIGFEPDCYPYAGVLFLLCLFAAARMRKPENQDRQGSRTDKPASSGKITEKAMSVPDSSSEYVQSSSYAAMRAQEEKEAFRYNNRPKIAAVTFLVILIIAMSLLVLFLMKTKRNRTRPGTTKETAAAASQNPVNDQYREEKGIDLSGEWISDTKQSSGAGMGATVSDDEIQIYWINSDGSRARYWTGNFKQMEVFQDPYTFISARTTPAETDNTFASQSQTLVFTYTDSDGILSFRTNVMGLPVTYRLHRA